MDRCIDRQIDINREIDIDRQLIRLKFKIMELQKINTLPDSDHTIPSVGIVVKKITFKSEMINDYIVEINKNTINLNVM